MSLISGDIRVGGNDDVATCLNFFIGVLDGNAALLKLVVCIPKYLVIEKSQFPLV